MFRKPVKEINAEFIAEEKYLDSIQRTVKESCVAAGMAKKETAAVLLAIEEAATNVIRHAYLYEKGIIRLRVVIYKKMAVFSLIDFGRSFQPDEGRTLDLAKLVETGRKGGLGFYMIQKIMDSVEYISTAGFNELRMFKRIGETSAGGRPILRRMFSLRVKFSVWTFIIVSVIIAASIYYFDHRISNQMYEHKHETILALGKTIADQAAGYLINRRSDVEFDQLTVSYKRANPELVKIVITDEANIIRAHSDDILNIRKEYQPEKNVNEIMYNLPQTMTHKDSVYNYFVTPILSGDRQLGKIHITYSTATIKAQLTEARIRFLGLTLILLMFGILGIYLLSNYFVTPILKITHRIRRFTTGDLETELPLEGAEEFFEISKALNQMMTRLSQDRKNLIEREKMAKEIELASEIQKTLMPAELPTVPGLEVESFYRAASMVGGDLYDIFRVDDNRYCLAVADVSGKGIPASLVTSMLRTVIQISAMTAGSAKETMLRVNDYVINNLPSGMFVTICLMFYSVAEKSLQIVSAGHNPLLFYSAGSRKVLKYNPKGIPLGVPVAGSRQFVDILEQLDVGLKAGDMFLVYTDGITEAADREGNQFGLEKLKKTFSECVEKHKDDKVDKISDVIINAVDDFCGFVKPQDDITYIVGRLGGESEEKDQNQAVENKPDIEKINIQSDNNPS